jgi:hypothetical protein
MMAAKYSASFLACGGSFISSPFSSKKWVMSVIQVSAINDKILSGNGVEYRLHGFG